MKKIFTIALCAATLCSHAQQKSITIKRTLVNCDTVIVDLGRPTNEHQISVVKVSGRLDKSKIYLQMSMGKKYVKNVWDIHEPLEVINIKSQTWYCKNEIFNRVVIITSGVHTTDVYITTLR